MENIEEKIFEQGVRLEKAHAALVAAMDAIDNDSSDEGVEHAHVLLIIARDFLEQASALIT